jgi:hypothetical protein
LVEKNKITKLHFLNGIQEAEAFSNQDYVKLHSSTLRKVDIFANIIGRVADNILKQNSKWNERYGITMSSISDYCKDHWLFSLLAMVGSIASIIGLLSLLK